MSKILDATCENGEVKCEGFVVPETTILSKGQGQSQGALILDGGEKTYIPNTQPDLETTLTHLITALEKAVTALNQAAAGLQAHDTAGFLIAASGGVASPPIAAANIAAVQSAAMDIEAAKGELETLKGNLI